jgi:hypothetical protein
MIRLLITQPERREAIQLWGVKPTRCTICCQVP